jgi:hypothetical protein
MSAEAVPAILKPPKPYYNHSIVFKVCQQCQDEQPKQSKRPRAGLLPELPDTQCRLGVCYFGSPPRMFWMNGDTDPYDGRSRYTLEDLTTDRAAGELMVSAIRTKLLLTSPDVLLNRALEHVFAAVHEGSQPKEDWLAWLCDILVHIPVQPLNSRGKPKLKHRGKGKASPLNRAAFVAKLPSGLTRKDQNMLWLDHKHSR